MKSVFDLFVQKIGRMPGSVQTASIALSAGTGETTLIDVGASEYFFVHQMVLVPGAGTLALWSGTVAAGQRITGDMVLPAAAVTFENLMGHGAGRDLIVNRGTSIVLTGHIVYSVL